MECPFCGKFETKVTDKRTSGNEIRRRRECLNEKCKKRFTTYERIEKKDIIVEKKDGRREKFDVEKLKSGIIKACEKRPINYEKIDKIINEIENKLRKKGREIKSNEIGELIIKKLKKLDKVAYIRFSSVYQDFKDIEDFKSAMKKIEKRKRESKTKIKK